MKQRLDQMLVERGLVSTREKAKALILAGKVLVNGQKIDKAGAGVVPESAIDLLEQLRYVSRGGLKLEGALRDFAIDPTGRIAIDIGTSTGGFTDCLLQHGATRVHCVDVGATQIDWKLKTDPRVVLHEHQNARLIEPSVIGELASLLVCDVSFISVTLLLDRFPALLEPAGEMVILVKPQFEVGRADVGKGGIVREDSLHQAACDKVESALRALGYTTRLLPSPILGGKGNREFLLHARPSR
ncbi:TlyA family RNA methyltransferase [Bryobacter aggregatus]|uniref:TlyA family RNA methyltransferase n=1 Tax=Bryobacter aggregatus TaxID=360054 RepID=UPI0004E27349|nr:TlyA family RNA methyltransferase [Bryobacter aggregatus]